MLNWVAVCCSDTNRPGVREKSSRWLVSTMVGTRSSLVTLVFFVTMILAPSTSGMMCSSLAGVFSWRSPITKMLGCGGLSASAAASAGIA